MKPSSTLGRFFSTFRSGTRSLKATLGLYFLPISILPAVFVSVYATRVFEESTRETVRRRAETERDAFIAEFQRLETDTSDSARIQAESSRLQSAVKSRSKSSIQGALAVLPENTSARVYSTEGKLLGSRLATWDSQASFLPATTLERVKSVGRTRERFFKEQGVSTVVRHLIRDRNRLHGVLELQTLIGQKQLADFKTRREVDTVFLNQDLSVGAASFALPPEFVKSFSVNSLPLPGGNPRVLNLGDVRFSAFLYELPAAFSRKQKDGYFVLFLSMTAADAAAHSLRIALVYLTVFLVIVVAAFIYLFSNRIVEPIELLVMGMKRLRTGKNEQLPAIDSPYEIEYLVHSFNDMARNIADAREALEDKVTELGQANSEIRDAQGALVQSAKMVSLGQLVAGVAHELNNPIGFISSNMHHLSEYVEKIRRLVTAYHQYRDQLPPAAKLEIERLESELEIDFILKDMLDLTRSCVEGANRTKEIVLGLRTFSRMDESNFKPCDLHEGLRNTVKLLVTEIKDRVAIVEEFGAIPDVECNLSQINQVFMNLLSNASQAIHGKGTIWIRTRRDGDRVRIEVEDNGGGMPAEVQAKIFDPFFTTKTVGKGTGLGLSIAYGLIEKHHGQIAVESQVGKGTRFTIYLPIRQPVVAMQKGQG